MKFYPSLPSQWKTLGYLYDAENRADLGEDMFEAKSADGILIDAGWTSEGNPDGEFQVSVTRGLTPIRPQFLTPDIRQAIEYIENTAMELSTPPIIITTAS